MSMSQVIPSSSPVSLRPEEGLGIGSDQGAIAVPRETLGERRDREPKRRAMLAVALVVLLGLVKVVLGVVVYGNIWEVYQAIGVACGGVLGFAIIDLWVWPRSDDHGAGRVRRFLPLWSFVPFVCALDSSAWVHYRELKVGLRDIRELACDLAKELNLAPSTPDKCKIASDQTNAGMGTSEQAKAVTSEQAKVVTSEQAKADMPEKKKPDDIVRIETLTFGKIAETVDTMVKQRFGERNATDEAAKFRDLARVVGHDLKRADGDIGTVVTRARSAMTLDFCITLGAQALFVLWIPFLLMMSIARANHKLTAREEAEGSLSAGRATDSPLPEARCLRDSLDLRDKRILAEDHSFFFPRLCFGTLLVLGTTYVFAPFGLKTSYIMSLVSDHALLGQTSFALWSNNFGAAPVMVVGFVGFLIYALITATQRFVQDDLDDQAIFALLIRGLVVVLLSFALSSSPINDEASRLFVFIAGVFPLRALEAIAKRVNITVDPDFPSDGPGSFDGIPSLDPAKVFALRAAGIQSTYDLAVMPIEEIVGRVRIDPRLLGRAVDRAILIDAIGPKLTAELEPFAITSATELVAVRPAIPEAVTAKLGDAPKRAADRLATDVRVEKVRRWLASAQG